MPADCLLGGGEIRRRLPVPPVGADDVARVDPLGAQPGARQEGGDEAAAPQLAGGDELVEQRRRGVRRLGDRVDGPLGAARDAAQHRLDAGGGIAPERRRDGDVAREDLVERRACCRAVAHGEIANGEQTIGYAVQRRDDDRPGARARADDADEPVDGRRVRDRGSAELEDSHHHS